MSLIYLQIALGCRVGVLSCILQSS